GGVDPLGEVVGADVAGPAAVVEQLDAGIGVALVDQLGADQAARARDQVLEAGGPQVPLVGGDRGVVEPAVADTPAVVGGGGTLPGGDDRVAPGGVELETQAARRPAHVAGRVVHTADDGATRLGLDDAAAGHAADGMDPAGVGGVGDAGPALEVIDDFAGEG